MSRGRALPAGDPLEIALSAAVTSRRAFPRAAPEGLEPNAAQVLVALVLNGPSSAHLLGERLALDASTVRHAIGQLERGRLVTRRAKHGDARVRVAEPTDKGLEVVAGIRARVADTMR